MGCKNAATPILAATLLTNEPVILSNVPKIGDVLTMIEILRSLGSEIEWINEHQLKISNKHIALERLDKKLIKKIRSSVLLLGPLLSRFKKVALSRPGGCFIGSRPLDTHFEALKQFRVNIESGDDLYRFSYEKLEPAEVILKEFSVTATENVLLLASAIAGKTLLKIAAIEPHVEDLTNFLRKLGVKIDIVSPHTFVIEGIAKFSGAEHRIIPDPIEAGTFLGLALILGGKRILVKNVIPRHLDIVFEKIREMGGQLELEKKDVYCNMRVYAPKGLLATKIQTLPYPGFPSDLQNIFGVVLTQAQGTSMIFDTLYEGRLKYLDELNKMGANTVILDPHRALIIGPTPLYGKEITSFDLRTGASLVLAALLAKGETTISNIEQIDRGYEQLEERFKNLGAEIKRV